MAALTAVHLGELYRELRLSRGLKMKDVVNSNLSQAQLSKFENGQTMLSADKLLTAISAIHMSFSEFEHAYHQYEDSSFFRLAKIISGLHTDKDVKGLENLLDHYDEQAESCDTYNRLNRLVICCAICDLKSGFRIPDADREFIATYLYSIEEWTEYELYIFGNTMQVLSDKDLIFLGKAFAGRSTMYLEIPDNRQRTELVFLNIIFELLERGQGDAAEYFMDQLECKLGYQDMFARACLIFFHKFRAYQTGQGHGRQPLDQYIRSVRELGFTEVADFLKDNFDRLLQGVKALP